MIQKQLTHTRHENREVNVSLAFTSQNGMTETDKKKNWKGK